MGCMSSIKLNPGDLLTQDSPIIVLDHDHKFKEWLAQGCLPGWGTVLLVFKGVVPLLLLFFALYLLPPLIILVVLGCDKLYTDLKDTYSLLRFKIGCEKLSSNFDNLDRDGQESILGLTTVFPSSATADSCRKEGPVDSCTEDPGLKHKIAGIFCTNSFMLEEGRSGIFPSVSRFNHSCRPNCSFTGEKVNGKFTIRVRAAREIKENEELTISYLDSVEEGAPTVTMDRRRYLQWAYRFRCMCEVCSLPLVQREIQDAKRLRLSQLRREWRLSDDPHKDWVNLQEQVGLLIDLGCCGKLEYLVSTLDLAWDALQDIGEEGRRHRLAIAELGVHWSRILYSSDNRVHWTWLTRIREARADKSPRLNPSN